MTTVLAGSTATSPGIRRGVAGRTPRPDIQALRAVAVASVLLYHLWPALVPGGFAGVDVFFVVSGYLIGGQLLAELDTTGRLRLGRFWLRRARRLLPAALLVLAMVTVCTLTVAPVSTRAGFLDQVLGSVLYVENWVLAGQSVDYLALGQAVSPVQHYWSLSVEEQLYVALPLVLALGGLAAGGRPRSGRSLALALVAGAAVASLVWSCLSTGAAPSVAYLSTGTRAWEFLAGTLLAGLTVSRRRPPVPPRALAALGAVGLALVGASVLLLTGAAPFPGWLALAPVLGAVLILAAVDRGPLALASRWRPVTWLGDVSYAVYLWHWPLIVLVPYVTRRALDLDDRLAVVLATLVLATVSTRYVEQPLRRATGGPGRLVVATLVAASLAVAGTAVVGAHATTGRQARQLTAARDVLRSADRPCLGAAALDPRTGPCAEPDDLLVPAPGSASLDDGNRTACWASFGDPRLHLCSLGDDDPDALRVLAVGDSHSNGYLPAYEELAARLGWHLDVAGRAGCSWSSSTQGGRTAAIAEECDGWKRQLAAHLAAHPPYDLILTTADQSGYLADPTGGRSARDATVAGFRQAWTEQVARGAAVVVIRDYPVAVPGVVQCVEEFRTAAGTHCSRPRDQAIPSFDALQEAVAVTPGAALVDLRDLMCTADDCLPVVGHVVVYRNRDHLTASFVRTLAPYLAERIGAAGPAHPRSARLRSPDGHPDATVEGGRRPGRAPVRRDRGLPGR